MPSYLPILIFSYLPVYMPSYLPFLIFSYLPVYMHSFLPSFIFNIFLSTCLPISSYLHFLISSCLNAFLSSFPHFLIPSCLHTIPIFLSSFLSSLISSYLLAFLSSYLPLFFSSCYPIFLTACLSNLLSPFLAGILFFCPFSFLFLIDKKFANRIFFSTLFMISRIKKIYLLFVFVLLIPPCPLPFAFKPSITTPLPQLHLLLWNCFFKALAFLKLAYANNILSLIFLLGY